MKKKFQNYLLLIFIIFNLFSCQGNMIKKEFDKNDGIQFQKKISSYDSTISELSYKNISIQVISYNIKDEMKQVNEKIITQLCISQKVAIIQDGKLLYLEIPIPLVDRKLSNGDIIKGIETEIGFVKIEKGNKGDFIWLRGEGKCTSCPNFDGFYTLSGNLLGYKYSKRNDEGGLDILSSLSSRKMIYEQYDAIIAPSIDLAKVSTTLLVINPYKSNITSSQSNILSSNVCLEGKAFNLPYTSETGGDYSGMLDNNIDCNQSIIESIGDIGYYDLITNNIGSFTISIFTFNEDNKIMELCTLNDTKIISSLTVYKHVVDYTVTPMDSTIATFKIEPDYSISIKEKKYEGEKLISSETKTYKIREDGQIIDLQTNKPVEFESN